MEGDKCSHGSHRNRGNGEQCTCWETRGGQQASATMRSHPRSSRMPCAAEQKPMGSHEARLTWGGEACYIWAGAGPGLLPRSLKASVWPFKEERECIPNKNVCKTYKGVRGIWAPSRTPSFRFPKLLLQVSKSRFHALT